MPNIFEKKVSTVKGKTVVELTPPGDAVALTINCTAGDASAYKAVTAAYSPTASFINVEQISEGIPDVGEDIEFKVEIFNKV